MKGTELKHGRSVLEVVVVGSTQQYLNVYQIWSSKWEYSDSLNSKNNEKWKT